MESEKAAAEKLAREEQQQQRQFAAAWDRTFYCPRWPHAPHHRKQPEEEELGSNENETGPCDKCDGKHATSKCPYFKRRDQHKDAFENYHGDEAAAWA